jgi:hypothetical protein
MSPVEHLAPYELPTLYTSVPNTEYYATATQYPIPQYPVQRHQCDEREHVQYDSTMFYHQRIAEVVPWAMNDLNWNA